MDIPQIKVQMTISQMKFSWKLFFPKKDPRNGQGQQNPDKVKLS